MLEKNWRAWLLLVGSWAVFFRAYLGDGVPYYRDILRTDLPLRVFIGEALRAGRIPQWYPFDGLGLPLIGNAEGLFRPFTLLYLWSNTLSAMKVEIAASYLLGLFGFYALGRTLKLNQAAASFGAIGFALSGYPVSLQSNLPYLAPYHTVPWVILAGVKALHAERPWRWVVWCSVLWAQVVLGGDPLLSVLVGFALVLTIAAEKKWRNGVRLAAAVPLTAGFCAVWVLPAFALFEDSLRKNWVPDGTTMSLHLARVPELLLGAVWLNSDQEIALKRALDGGGELWAPSIFIGTTVVCAAVLAVRLRSRPATLWVVAALMLTWAALGTSAGLLAVLRAVIPLLGSFRYPEKYLAMATFAWCVAGAYGIDGAPSLSPMVVRRTLLVAGTAVVGLLAISSLALHWHPEWLSLTSEMGPDLTWLWAWGGVLSLGFLAATFASLRASRRWPQLTLAAPALLALELSISGSHLNWLAPREVLQTQPAFCRAARDAGAAFGQSRVLTNVAHFPRFVSELDGASWTAATLNLMEPDNSALCGLESIVQPNLSGVSGRLWHALETVDRWRIAHLFSAGVGVVETDSKAPMVGPTLATGGTYAVVSTGAPALPRAYAADPVWVASADEALAKLPTVADGQVLVEGPSQPAAGPSSPQLGDVQVVSYEPDEVVLNATLQSTRAVVLNDLWSKGWHATLDGQPLPIYRANFLVRAVMVPAGQHEVRFGYETPHLQLGFSISALFLALSLALMLREQRMAHSLKKVA